VLLAAWTSFRDLLRQHTQLLLLLQVLRDKQQHQQQRSVVVELEALEEKLAESWSIKQMKKKKRTTLQQRRQKQMNGHGC
jgi:hypothetical protein